MYREDKIYNFIWEIPDERLSGFMKDRRLNCINVNYFVFLFLILLFSFHCNAEGLIRDPEKFRSILEEIRSKRKLPAIAASVVIGKDIAAASAVGYRKWGEDVKVTRRDPFQLGSVSKPVTGTLIGILADEGRLNWDTTIGDVYPELFEGRYGGYKKVTVRQLIGHTSGLPYQPKTKQVDIDADGNNLIERRVAYVSAAISDRPQALPGRTCIYSGGGVIAASMAEKITGKSWERLVTELIFSKLFMKTAGFGPMATFPDCLDAPWYHQNINGEIKPLSPEEAIINFCQGNVGICRNPVGGVICSVIDLGRFSAFHLLCAQGKKPAGISLKQDNLKEFCKVVESRDKKNKRYSSAGWRVQPTNWARGPVYWHSGQSRGCGYALVHIVPEQNYATCILINIGGKEAQKAAGELNMLIVEELKKNNYKLSRLFGD